MELEIKHLKAIDAIGSSAPGLEGNNYSKAARLAFGRLMGWIQQEGLAPKMIGCAGSGDAPGSKPDAECQYTALAWFEPGVDFPPLASGIERVCLEAGAYACVLHKGPYEKLGDTWTAVHKELDRPGSRIKPRCGSCYEVYLNSPGQVAAEDLLTEIRIPVES